MNPIVVRELRQAMQGRFISSITLLFLLVQMVILGFALLSFDGVGASPGASLDTGRWLFIPLFGTLLAACLFIPMFTARRLASERSGADADLLFITTLSPRRIIWGKFLCAMTLTILLYSASLPFITLTYMLRGIDIPTILLVMSAGFVLVGMCVMLAILQAALPIKGAIRILLWIGFGLGLFGVFWWAMMLVGPAVLFGVGSTVRSPLFWPVTGLVLACVGLVMGLWFVLSVALVSPPSSNRALLVRGYIAAMWLISGIGAAVAGYFLSRLPSTTITEILITFWFIFQCGFLCLIMLGAVSERDGIGPRVTRAIPRHRLLRVPAFLFYSGSAGGIAWCVSMLVLTLLGAWVWGLWNGVNGDLFLNSVANPGPLAETMPRMLSICLYVLAYALTAYRIRLTLFKRSLQPRNTWVLAVLLMALGTVLPMLFSFLLYKRIWWDASIMWRIGNPLASVMEVSSDALSTFLIIPGIWCLVMGLLCLPYILKQSANFKPYRGSHRANENEAASTGQAVVGDQTSPLPAD